MSSAYTPCQAKALTMLHGKENIFLTGAAGTGKSWLITQFLANKGRKEFPIVASTGTAALLVDGRTFHSFFGLGIMEGGKEATVRRALQNKQIIKRLDQAECVVLDEVSMLSGETLATAEQIACEARMSDEPWGGLRIIAVGDFAQLPPVQRNGEPQDWAFLHPIWDHSRFASVHLETTVRTSDSELLSVLNRVRTGAIDELVHDFFAQRAAGDVQEFNGTMLFAHRRSVDQYNQQQLDAIDSPAVSFPTIYDGNAQYIQRIKRDCPLPEVLTLKKNALVMLRKNDTAFPYKYVNGSLARVLDMSEDTLYLQLLEGKTIELQKQFFTQFDGHGQERANAYNFPVALAWATTIHKAQGASIDRLLVDLSRLWEPGQAYVALSRARSATGLFIRQWEPSSIIADPQVQQFYQAIAEEWEHRSRHIEETSMDVIEQVVERKTRLKKLPNHKRTLALIEQQKSLEEMELELGWKQGTLINHITKLLQEGNKLDIAYLKPEPAIFGPIADCMQERGYGMLKPIFEYFDGEYSYDDIRLVAVFLLEEELKAGVAL